MTCGCIVPTHVFADLEPYMAQLQSITWGMLNNVEVIANQLYRNGGTPNTSDAYGYSSNFVEGTGCGLWECRQFFDDVSTNNGTYFVLEDEFGGPDKYGWSFTNNAEPWRRTPYHGTITNFPIYYGPEGGPAPPDQVGYNVGFRFGIYYNNGTVRVYENNQWTNNTNDFFGEDNFSYTFTGLPTDRRWRLKAYAFPLAADAHSPIISEFISGPSDICGDATWALPPLRWSATGTVSNPPRAGIQTMRFDAGNGSEWYLVPPPTDSGHELRSKTMKAMRATGKLTNASMQAYGYDIGDPIDTDALESGDGASTRSQRLTDSSQVAQHPRKPINVKNAVLHTVRISGDDRGQAKRDEIHEIVVEVAIQGVRR